MVVIGLKRVARFLRNHPECRQEVAELVRELGSGTFSDPQSLHGRYPSCKVLDGSVVVFRVRGNRYRLSVQVAYNAQTMVVLALETHAEYDRRTLR